MNNLNGPSPQPSLRSRPGPAQADPLWYKDAIIYELHVRAFADSNGDGIGDFAGLTAKLPYLKDLGINTIWLLPFYPSPLRDDGYDIADYKDVNPAYGTLSDFRTFLDEAHRRDLRVITELVLNHTSDQHPWFQRARRAPEGSRWRNWYVWSPTTERYQEARVIFQDYESSNWSWDAVAKAYYWHRFYSHQPDLNFDHPEVHEAMFEIVDFWLDLGVDGFRLDAIPYLYERQGTSCENIPETHDFLRKLRAHVDARTPGRVLLAEANQWPEDAIAYFGRGDECNMAFHFPIMARMFLSVQMEDRFPMVDILAQTPPIPDTAQWALFLRNHDELTLEMVTDEERDYMYRVYARDQQARFNLGIRRRLAPLLQNNRKKIELMNALLFSLPGTPVVYYGDEIGMGDNIFLGDRNGVRTPMQWSGDRNAGFSRTNAQRLYLPPTVDPEYHYEAVNVEAQQANSQSLLWWMKRLLALSRHWKAFGRGSIEVLAPENRKVLAFLRSYQDEVVLVVANLSRFSQYVELDLEPLEGRIPVELFGRTEFPKIQKTPYLLTLGPHSFYWFSIESARSGAAAPRSPIAVRRIEVTGSWEALFEGRSRTELEKAMEAHLPQVAWFSSNLRRTKAVRISQVIPFPVGFGPSALLILEIEYFEGESESYSVPVVLLPRGGPEAEKKEPPREGIAEVRIRDGDEETEGLLVDGFTDEDFGRRMANLLTWDKSVRTGDGSFTSSLTSAYREFSGPEGTPVTVSIVKEGPCQGSLLLGSRLLLTWIRKVEPGGNAELEVVRALTEETPRPPLLPLAGHLQYQARSGAAQCIAFLRGCSPGSTEAWTLTLDELDRYFERVRTAPELEEAEAHPLPRLRWSVWEPPPHAFQLLIGPYLASALQLGRSTALLHTALLRAGPEPGLGAEPLGPSQQRSIYQTLRKKLMRTLPLLGRRLSAAARVDAKRLAQIEEQLGQFLKGLLTKRVGADRLRCHGDLTLHRFLSIGSEFILTDWSGPAECPSTERRIKRTPLSDVASMIHSFRSAATHVLQELLSSEEVAPERWPLLEDGAAAWYSGVAGRYLNSYREGIQDSGLKLGNAEELHFLLNIHLLEKILDDLGGVLGRAGTPDGLVLKQLNDLLDVLHGGSKPDPEAAPGQGVWPEPRRWMKLLGGPVPHPVSSTDGPLVPDRPALPEPPA